jgi:hypothetical protein
MGLERLQRKFCAFNRNRLHERVRRIVHPVAQDVVFVWCLCGVCVVSVWCWCDVGVVVFVWCWCFNLPCQRKTRERRAEMTFRIAESLLSSVNKAAAETYALMPQCELISAAQRWYRPGTTEHRHAPRRHSCTVFTVLYPASRDVGKKAKRSHRLLTNPLSQTHELLVAGRL